MSHFQEQKRIDRDQSEVIQRLEISDKDFKVVIKSIFKDKWKRAQIAAIEKNQIKALELKNTLSEILKLTE